MQTLIETIVKELVDVPENVSIKVVEGETIVVYELTTDKSDLGKVIGKKGKTALALRTILTAASAKRNKKRAVLEIIQDDRKPSSNSS